MVEVGLRIKALFLLLSFLGVQLVSIACAFINLAHEVSHAQVGQEKHHHDHAHHHSDSEKPNTDTEEGNCCVENSSIFLSGIEAIPSTIHWIKPFNSIQFITLLDDRTDFVYLYETIVRQIRPPPLIIVKSIFLRIIIQSFQI